MVSDKLPPDDDELDRLLHQARWPEPRDEQTSRLGAYWRQIQSARRRRRLTLGGLALAASVLLVVAILTDRTAPPPEVVADSKTFPTEPHEPSRPAPDVAHTETSQPAPAADQPAVSRDPNLYEQVVLMQTMAKTHPRAAVINKEDRADLMNQLIEVLANNPQAKVAERLTPLQTDLADCEHVLWKFVRTASGARRTGAAGLLSRIGSARSLPVLWELAGEPATHEVALVGLARLATDRDLARLASAEPDAGLRRTLLRGLLERQTFDAVGLYLGFVNDIRSRSEALDVLADLPDPPADALLGYLENPHQPVRLAAALALARVPDPNVVERVCARVAGIGRREALIALLLSSSEQASGCLNQARENLYLVASVQAAEQQLHSMQIPRGGNLP